MKKIFNFIILILLYLPNSYAQQSDDFDLHRFAYIGDLPKVKIALKNADINSKSKDGITALLWAGFNNNTYIIKYLLASNANFNTISSSGRNILTYAIYNKNIEIIKLLLSKNIESEPYKDGKDQLFDAVNANDIDVLKLIIPHFPDTNKSYIIKSDDKYYRTQTTLLLQAINNHNIEIVKLLIKNNANIDQANSRGETPLLSAMRNRTYKIANYLIDKGVKLNTTDIAGNSLLSYSIKAQNEGLALKAIASNMDLDVKITFEVAKESSSAYEYYIHSPNQDELKYNYLQMSAIHGLKNITKMLLDKNANISSFSNDTLSLDAVGIAAFYGRTDSLILLLQSGANPYRIYKNSIPQGNLGLAYFTGSSQAYTLLSLALISQNRDEVMINYLLDLPKAHKYSELESEAFYINMLLATNLDAPNIFNKVITKVRKWGFTNSDILDSKYQSIIRKKIDKKQIHKTITDIILNAVIKGDLKKLNKIKDNGVNISKEAPDAVFIAIMNNQEHLVLPLLEMGIDIHRSFHNQGTSTILHFLAKYSNRKKYSEINNLFLNLIQKGLNINEAPEEKTPLFVMLQTDLPDMELIKLLITNDADFGNKEWILRDIYTMYNQNTYELIVTNPIFSNAMHKLYITADLFKVAKMILASRDPITYQPKYTKRVEKLMNVAYQNDYKFDLNMLAEYAKIKKYEDIERAAIFYGFNN